MSIQPSSDARDWRTALVRAVGAPTRPRTYRRLCYLALMFPLGIAYFNLVVVGFTTGLGLAIVGVGIPIIVLLLVVATGLAALERTLVRALLDVEITAAPVAMESGLWARTKQLVTDGRTWKAHAYLLSVFAFGTIAFGVLTSLLATAWSFVSAPLYYRDAPVVAYGPVPRGDVTLEFLFGWDTLLVGLTTTFRLGSWQIETLPGALAVAGLGVILLLATVQLGTALASLWGRYARAMLTVPNYWRLSDR